MTWVHMDVGLVVWLLAATAVGVLLGRSIALADRREFPQRYRDDLARHMQAQAKGPRR